MRHFLSTPLSLCICQDIRPEERRFEFRRCEGRYRSFWDVEEDDEQEDKKDEKEEDKKDHLSSSASQANSHSSSSYNRQRKKRRTRISGE
ncbi:hypothetical protein CSUI_011423, partial [Cystoisospora suis]